MKRKAHARLVGPRKNLFGQRPLYVFMRMFEIDECQRRQASIAWTLQLLRLRFVCRWVGLGSLGCAVLIAGDEAPSEREQLLFNRCMEGGLVCPLDHQRVYQEAEAQLRDFICEGWATIRNE